MTPNHSNAAWHSTKASLTQERASFTGDPKTKPTRLPIAEIEEESALFQPRLYVGAEALSAEHVEMLAKALSQAGAADLEPITIWWTGRRWVLVDGHRRMEAYRRHSGSTRGIKAGAQGRITIPVLCLTGSLKDALKTSLQGNSRDKLPMRHEEKGAAAWRMTCVDDGTPKADIAAMCGISERTVANMRSVRKTLIAGGADGKRLKPGRISGLSWEDARKRANGETERPDYDSEAVQEAWAQEMALRLSNTFKDKLTKAPQVAARAIEIHSPELVRSLVETWMGSIPGMASHVRAILNEQQEDEGFMGDAVGCGDF